MTMTATTLQQLNGVLLDRDGTLIRDVPYNGDPALVELMPGAVQAVNRLRTAGLKVGIMSNQSGIGRGLFSSEQLWAVNSRVEELLGALDAWFICPHVPEDACLCRKPQAGMVLAAASHWGFAVKSLAVIGDIGADIDAAAAAGCRSVLVPTAVTMREEIARAPHVAVDLVTAVTELLESASTPSRGAPGPGTPGPGTSNP